MGDKYQCRDCKGWFKAFYCHVCGRMETRRDYFCHFDYMNDRRRRDPDEGIFTEQEQTAIGVRITKHGMVR